MRHVLCTRQTCRLAADREKWIDFNIQMMAEAMEYITRYRDITLSVPLPCFLNPRHLVHVSSVKTTEHR